jgi:hypothetical protein
MTSRRPIAFRRIPDAALERTPLIVLRWPPYRRRDRIAAATDARRRIGKPEAVGVDLI